MQTQRVVVNVESLIVIAVLADKYCSVVVIGCSSMVVEMDGWQ